MVNLKIKEEREKKKKKRLLVLNQSPFNNTCHPFRKEMP